MPQLVPTAETYICPGQSHSISRSVHLARLAAWYPACRECAFRDDVGAIALDRPDTAAIETAVTTTELITTDGFRGRHRNEFDRGLARRLSAAFAAMIWERQTRNVSPQVVVGIDQRPSAADLFAGVVDGLKRMSCGVIDIGPVSYPQFASATGMTGANAGILITGAGCDPSRTGLDLVFGDQPVPPARLDCDFTGPETPTLAEIQDRATQPVNRPARSAGAFRTVRTTGEYRDKLRTEFHALRPLKVLVAVPTACLRANVESLFADLPCRLTLLDLPLRRRDLTDADDVDVRRLSSAVERERFDVGFVIDEDGQICAACDERGRLIPVPELTVWLTDGGSRFNNIVLGQGITRDFLGPRETGIDVTHAVETRFAMQQSALKTRARFAATSTGRYWLPFGDHERPVCDALLTLANVLAAMSRSDRPCSQLVEQAAHGGS